MTTTSPRFGPTSQRIAHTAAASCCIIFAAMLSFGCENDAAIDFTNGTERVVEVYQGGKFAFELEPGETRGIATFKKDWLPEILVVADDGMVVLDESITWQQLESMDFLIVITEPG